MWSKIKSVLTLTLLLGASAVAARAEVAVGQTFPRLADAALQGALPETGGKVVLVDFCASWCAPCKQSFPTLSQLQADFGGRGLVIVGVSVDAKASDYEAVVRKWKPGFAVVHDAAHRLVAQVKVPTMPTSYLLDRKGVVRFVHAGFHPKTETELRTQIEQLLKE